LALRYVRSADGLRTLNFYGDLHTASLILLENNRFLFLNNILFGLPILMLKLILAFDIDFLDLFTIEGIDLAKLIGPGLEDVSFGIFCLFVILTHIIKILALLMTDHERLYPSVN